MEIVEGLKSLGLTEKEANVYIGSLKIGQSTVQGISEEAGTYRTYTYEVLKGLCEKGLMSGSIRSGVKYFEAVDPEKLRSIEKEREEILKKIVSELKKIRGSVIERPEVNFFTGMEGIKTIHELILKENPKEILVYGNSQRIIEFMVWHFSRYVRERVEKGIKARVITERSEKTLGIIGERGKIELRETRFFPDGFRFPTIKYIFGDKVANILMGKEPAGIVVESKDIADGEREAFEVMWAEVG